MWLGELWLSSVFGNCPKIIFHGFLLHQRCGCAFSEFSMKLKEGVLGPYRRNQGCMKLLKKGNHILVWILVFCSQSWRPFHTEVCWDVCPALTNDHWPKQPKWLRSANQHWATQHTQRSKRRRSKPFSQIPSRRPRCQPSHRCFCLAPSPKSCIHVHVWCQVQSSLTPCLLSNPSPPVLYSSIASAENRELEATPKVWLPCGSADMIFTGYQAGFA